MPIPPAGPVTARCWQQITPIYEQIITSEFISKLADGTLRKSCFGHYLQQDVIYLRYDNEALQKVSLRTQNREEQHLFELLATDGIAMEQVVRTTYLSSYGLTEANQQSPAFSSYCRFLQHHSEHSPISIAIAALLPCFWVYGTVGKYVDRMSKPNNPYQLFIDTYSGEEYAIYTIQLLEIFERYGARATSEEKQKLIETFTIGTRHELAVLEEAMQY